MSYEDSLFEQGHTPGLRKGPCLDPIEIDSTGQARCIPPRFMVTGSQGLIEKAFHLASHHIVDNQRNRRGLRQSKSDLPCRQPKKKWRRNIGNPVGESLPGAPPATRCCSRASTLHRKNSKRSARAPCYFLAQSCGRVKKTRRKAPVYRQTGLGYEKYAPPWNDECTSSLLS